MKPKKQIIFIHGGMTFRRRKDYLDYLKKRPVSIEKKSRWSGEYLEQKLGKIFDIVRLRMPLSEDAKYAEWKIHFERYLPFIRSGAVFIGFSLGGIFLSKYFSESRFARKVGGLFLVAPPFDDTVKGEDLAGGFRLKPDLSLIEKNAKNLHLFFSEDDPVVPLSHARKYANRLKKANIVIYKSMGGHFQTAEFPELVRLIRISGKGK